MICDPVARFQKTMLTASAVRSDAVRANFKVICWLNLSQQPDLMRLQVDVGSVRFKLTFWMRSCAMQQRLHEQLADSKSIPTESSNTIEQQKDALVKAAAGKNVLIVLDGGGD